MHCGKPPAWCFQHSKHTVGILKECNGFSQMPSWLLPALLTGGLTVLLGALAVIWAEIKASEARKQDALKGMEARQREETRELRATVDRLIEGLLAAKAP